MIKIKNYEIKTESSFGKQYLDLQTEMRQGIACVRIKRVKLSTIRVDSRVKQLNQTNVVPHSYAKSSNERQKRNFKV